MKDISKNILKQIKEKNIKPRSRWVFLLKNYGLWLAYFFSVLFGSLAVALIFDNLLGGDWDIYPRISHRIFDFLLMIMPYFWLIFLAIFIFLGDWYLKNTKKAYRFSLWKISLFSVLLSVVLGFSFYKLGYVDSLEELSLQKTPKYHHIFFSKEKVWMQADKGFLLGEITNLEKDFFLLKDLNNNNWRITTTSKTFIAPILRLGKGEKIKMIGQKKEDYFFEALEIRPLRGMMHGHGLRNCERK